MEELRDRMVEYRARHDLSQQELADRCNVTKQTIWAVEKGIQHPTKKTRKKIDIVITEN